MKTLRHFGPFLAAICLPCLLIAQESNPGTTGAATPAVDPNSPDVQSSTTYDLGDRRMVVQEVTEATLPIQPPPAPQAPAATTPINLPADVVAARTAMLAKLRSLTFGGTIYKTADGTCRSLIDYRPPEGGDAVVFWSSIDWDLLSVSSDFASAEGLKYTLMNMVSSIDIPRTEAIRASRGRTYQPPVIPEFSAGAASYHIVSGSPNPAQVADLNAIHAYHDREYAALVAAQARREEARRLAEEAAKQPQPPPPDIIIQGRPMTPEELRLFRGQDTATSKP